MNQALSSFLLCAQYLKETIHFIILNFCKTILILTKINDQPFKMILENILPIMKNCALCALPRVILEDANQSQYAIKRGLKTKGKYIKKTCGKRTFEFYSLKIKTLNKIKGNIHPMVEKGFNPTIMKHFLDLCLGYNIILRSFDTIFNDTIQHYINYKQIPS